MKPIGLVKLLVFGFFSLMNFSRGVEGATSSVFYAQASVDDIPGILLLYEGLDGDDSERLVVYPAEVRAQVLHEAITARRFFVARDETGVVVAFCKLYIVPQKELDDLVSDELGACAYELGASAEEFFTLSPKKPAFAGVYNISPSQIRDFGVKIDSMRLGDVAPYQYRPEEDVYIYYGSAYTRPDHRGCGVNTDLEKFAFTSVLETISSLVGKRKFTLFYSYGVVKSNLKSNARFRSFADFICKILGDKIADDSRVPIEFRGFSTHKPVIEVVDHRACPSPLGSPLRASSPDGFGCFVSFSFA